MGKRKSQTVPADSRHVLCEPEIRALHILCSLSMGLLGHFHPPTAGLGPVNRVWEWLYLDLYATQVLIELRSPR